MKNFVEPDGLSEEFRPCDMKNLFLIIPGKKKKKKLVQQSFGHLKGIMSPIK